MRVNQFIKLLAKKSFHLKNARNFGAVAHDSHGHGHEGEHHVFIFLKFEA